MRVERKFQQQWGPVGQRQARAEMQAQERIQVCPACGAQGLEIRTGPIERYLCISCNHTWGA